MTYSFFLHKFFSSLLRYRKSIRKRLFGKLVYDCLCIYSSYPRGSVRWLQSAEKHFGGLTGFIPRGVVSPHEAIPSDIEPRTAGGDRMFHRNYAPVYSRHLSKFLLRQDLVILECGILRGSGLALWSSLFPSADIIGLDINPQHCLDNLPFLRSRGAFSSSAPRLLHFDQLAPDTSELKNYLSGRGIDIFIDDGLHTPLSIMNTLGVIYPLLNTNSVCFIEDIYDEYSPDCNVVSSIMSEYPSSAIFPRGEMLIMENQ